MNEPASSDTITIDRSMFEAMQAKFESMQAQILSLTEQVDWFKRQLFGPKSEKRYVPDEGEQGSLFAAPDVVDQDQPAAVAVPAHTRCKHRTGQEVNNAGLRFDPNVPVREIKLSCPELQGPHADRYEIIDHKVSLRLARQPGSHVVLKYLRPVLREKTSGQMSTVAAPVGVLDHAQADVSMLAGMIIDKFVYHLPLYRQHQRLVDEGIRVSRTTLDLWMRDSIALLTPISHAVLKSVLSGAHLKIDETPIPAGVIKTQSGPRAGQGKIKQAWMWPILGEHGDIAFGYSNSRSLSALKSIIGQSYQGTIQTDGYSVYNSYQSALPQCTHALCWAHARRMFLKAEQSDPQAVNRALQAIRALYKIEENLREQAADAQMIVQYRQTHSKPIVDEFFKWVDALISEPGLLPSSPLAKALHYARERQQGLRVFLFDAWLNLDTNDLERALRVIPMGKKNWLFCMTEAGGEQVAVIQTLLATCRAHGIDPYKYLVDVLQRINVHPNDQIEKLTPRIWAQRFEHDPLISDLQRCL
jgi:transposase